MKFLADTELTHTLLHPVANETFRTLAPKATYFVCTQSISAARCAQTLVHIVTPLRPGIAIETVRAVAAITTLKIHTDGARSTGPNTR
jgi:hypothetical protein